MRPARLAVITLATALLAACGNDPTAPTAAPSGTPLRTGWLTSTGSKAPVGAATTAPIVSSESCRAGWLTSTGRCE